MARMHGPPAVPANFNHEQFDSFPENVQMAMLVTFGFCGENPYREDLNRFRNSVNLPNIEADNTHPDHSSGVPDEDQVAGADDVSDGLHLLQQKPSVSSRRQSARQSAKRNASGSTSNEDDARERSQQTKAQQAAPAPRKPAAVVAAPAPKKPEAEAPRRKAAVTGTGKASKLKKNTKALNASNKDAAASTALDDQRQPLACVTDSTSTTWGPTAAEREVGLLGLLEATEAVSVTVPNPNLSQSAVASSSTGQIDFVIPSAPSAAPPSPSAAAADPASQSSSSATAAAPPPSSATAAAHARHQSIQPRQRGGGVRPGLRKTDQEIVTTQIQELEALERHPTELRLRYYKKSEACQDMSLEKRQEIVREFKEQAQGEVVRILDLSSSDWGFTTLLGERFTANANRDKSSDSTTSSKKKRKNAPAHDEDDEDIGSGSGEDVDERQPRARRRVR
ncbi:hypothetical protein HDU96_000250 [Phlyctochytrium bullatum]|nr:hypothetical protein HDU96_000250 [Phlyctochytrium bullatum]